MATSTANIIVGSATVSIGAYVAAAGAGTLVDVGHTKTPTELQVAFEHLDVKSEQRLGTLKKIPTDASVKLKVAVVEVVIDRYVEALKQATGNKSGISPNFTLLVGEPQEKYHQIQLVTKGHGTVGTRTITIWRATIESLAATPFGKGIEQLLETTIDCLLDETVATADKFFKIVDS